MAWVLILGAIPSGLAGTISTATGFYFVRFFIGEFEICLVLGQS
jgi:NNP family nitrate/nitrite transporter-like MFS transporter